MVICLDYLLIIMVTKRLRIVHVVAIPQQFVNSSTFFFGKGVNSSTFFFGKEKNINSSTFMFNNCKNELYNFKTEKDSSLF